MMYRKLCFLTSIVLVLGLMMPATIRANLLTNGSFETATDDGYGHMVPDGWGVYVTGGVDWGNVDHNQVIDGTAQDLLAYWMLDDHTAEEVLLGIQDLGILPDVTYTFDIWLRDPDGGTAEIGFEFWGHDGTNPTDWWGQMWSGALTLDGTWQQFSYSTPKWAGSYFKAMIKVDNNIIHADNASVIPEPTTMVLLGLGTLMALRRRRHQ